MNKQDEKYNEIITKFMIITNTIIIVVALIAISFELAKEPKEAHAQEITYTIEQGMYTFNESIVFKTNQIPVQPGETHIIGANDGIDRITFNPVFKNAQVTPEEGTETPTSLSKATGIDIWATTQKIEIYYTVPNDNTGTYSTEIYNITDGWYYELFTGPVNNQTYHKIKIASYTVIITQNISVQEYEFWWWNANTTRVGAQNQQTGNITDYNTGYEAGYQQGQADKVQNEYGTYESAYNAGHTAGYDEGFTAGYNKYAGENPYTFHNLITAVMRAPSEFIKSFWGTEILGINLAGLFSAMITVAVVISVFAIIKKFI